jgi:hypothetical protein
MTTPYAVDVTDVGGEVRYAKGASELRNNDKTSVRAGQPLNSGQGILMQFKLMNRLEPTPRPWSGGCDFKCVSHKDPP